MSEHAGKVHKPAADHPWRKIVTPTIAGWAKESSDQPKTNDWRVGGGKDPWNGRK